MEDRRRQTWFILARLIVVSLFLASTIVLRTREPGSVEEWAFDGLLKLFIATYAFSAITLWALRTATRSVVAIAYFQIIWDLLFVTVLLLFTGGIESPFSFLYFLSIINASVLISRREAVYTASLCGILYGAILDFQFYGYLASFGLPQYSAREYGGAYLLYTIFIHIIAFCVTAVLTGSLAERARKTEHDLRKKEIDLDELETLNNCIVANIDSSVITVTADARIRVFNPQAEVLTGRSLADVYDMPLSDVIPALAERLGDPSGEAVVRSAAGAKIVRFAISALDDKDGIAIGKMLICQDVTVLKRMEVALQRATRMAGIGELAARIAHEIRNPLASISGAVQVISQGGHVDPADHRLLRIVVQETERLDGLIEGFLDYSRQRVPLKRRVPLLKMVEDVRLLCCSDSRCAGVQFRHEIPADLMINVDVDQFKQVLWNLVKNSVEAMSATGTLSIAAAPGEFPPSPNHVGRCIRVAVSDTGTGIPQEDVPKIFEPFFSRKQGGSGLGLATVYRIIEAHGGVITVESSPGSGTTFSIFLEQ